MATRQQPVSLLVHPNGYGSAQVMVSKNRQTQILTTFVATKQLNTFSSLIIKLITVSFYDIVVKDLKTSRHHSRIRPWFGSNQIYVKFILFKKLDNITIYVKLNLKINLFLMAVGRTNPVMLQHKFATR